MLLPGGPGQFRTPSAVAVDGQGNLYVNELAGDGASTPLVRLAQLVADGRLRPLIAVEAPWTQAGNVAQRFLDRGFPGKAMLLVS